MPAYRGVRRIAAACLAILLLLEVTAALALLAAVWPESGDRILEKGSLRVDASHAAQGYILASAKSGEKLKLRISLGDMTYTYDLNGEGASEVFPLQMGSGRYVVSLYKNVKANRYSKDAEMSLDVQLDREEAAFLCPSQYVNYTPDSPAVQKSEELCAGLTSDAEKLEAVREFMSKSFVYDYVRALTGPGQYLGDIDGCYETRMGLCQDLAAVAACMLRVQGIPTQLVIGQADNMYHAWNSVLIDGEYRHLDITAALGGFSKDVVYTAERRY